MIRKYGPNDIIHFGKHKGKRIHEIASEDPSYITWMLESIPAFFITPEDMLNLMLHNQDLKLIGEQQPHYLRKQSIFEFQFMMSLPQTPPHLWSQLKTTRRNKARLKRVKPLLSSYKLFNLASLLFECGAAQSWQYCELGVDSSGCPMIRVYANMQASLCQRNDSEAALIAKEGMLSSDFPTLVKLEINMDTPGFGALAYRLVELRLLQLPNTTV
jgi:hypothetical protein